MNNLFAQIPRDLPDERTEALVETASVRVERIVSAGQATAPGRWYDQEWDEWVVLLQGGAGLLFEGDDRMVVMRAGDWIHIPAHRRHRVEWTDPAARTVWLAVHYRADGKTPDA